MKTILATTTTTLILISAIGYSALAAPACVVPEAPPAYLDLVSNPRVITAVAGTPERTRLYDLITKKNDIPDFLSDCRMTQVEITGEDPLTKMPREVQTMSYAAKDATAENLRTIVLLPPTGGENALDDAYASRLCDDGFRVVLVQHWAGADVAELDLDMHDRGAMRATAAVEDVIEFIHPKSAGQLGILGTSVGAITSSLILGTDVRVATGVLIVGGGGMSEIIGTSSEETLAKLRAARIADPSFGFKNQNDYIKALAQHVKIEPLNFVKLAVRKKILFFLATQDITVPTANQYKLYHAFGDQELVTHDADHFHTILYTAWKEKDRISTFFKANLQVPTAAEIAHPKSDDSSQNKLCRNIKKT